MKIIKQDLFVFRRLFQLKYLTSPLATDNRQFYVDDKGSYVAYTFVYVFGLRVASIQRNEPWKA